MCHIGKRRGVPAGQRIFFCPQQTHQQCCGLLPCQGAVQIHIHIAIFIGSRSVDQTIAIQHSGREIADMPCVRISGPIHHRGPLVLVHFQSLGISHRHGDGHGQCHPSSQQAPLPSMFHSHSSCFKKSPKVYGIFIVFASHSSMLYLNFSSPAPLPMAAKQPVAPFSSSCIDMNDSLCIPKVFSVLLFHAAKELHPCIKY